MKILKPATIALAIVAMLSSCKIQAPVFKDIENMKLERVSFKGIKFGAEAVFYNPNRIKCTLTDLAVDILVDNKRVGTLGEKTDVPIKKHTDFRIPMGATLNPEGTILDNIRTLVDVIKDKEATLSIQGNVKIKFIGITIPVKFSHDQKIRLSQLH